MVLGEVQAALLAEMQLDQLLSQYNPIMNVMIHGQGNSFAEMKIPKNTTESLGGYVIPRIELDNTLFSLATTLGAESRCNRKFIKAVFDDSSSLWNIHLLNTSNNNEEIVRSRILIGADGARSRVRKILGVPFNTPENEGIAIRYYCKTKIPHGDTIRFYFNKELLPGYGWIFPIDKNMANIGIIIDLKQYESQNSNLNEMMTQFIRNVNENVHLPINECNYESFILPYSSQLPKLSFKSAALLGDAASMINPFTGEGIYYGMYAGKILGQLLGNAINEKRNLQNALDNYEKLFLDKFKKHIKWTMVLKRICKYPVLINFIITKILNNKLIFDKLNSTTNIFPKIQQN